MQFSQVPRFQEDKENDVPGPGYYDVMEDILEDAISNSSTIKKKENARTKTAKLKAALQRALTTQEALKSRLRLIQSAREKEKKAHKDALKSSNKLLETMRSAHEKVSKEAARKQMEIDTALRDVERVSSMNKMNESSRKSLEAQRDAMIEEHERAISDLERKWNERVSSSLRSHTESLSQLEEESSRREKNLQQEYMVALNEEQEVRTRLMNQIREVESVVKTVRIIFCFRESYSCETYAPT